MDSTCGRCEVYSFNSKDRQWYFCPRCQSLYDSTYDIVCPCAYSHAGVFTEARATLKHVAQPKINPLPAGKNAKSTPIACGPFDINAALHENGLFVTRDGLPYQNSPNMPSYFNCLGANPYSVASHMPDSFSGAANSTAKLDNQASEPGPMEHNRRARYPGYYPGCYSGAGNTPAKSINQASKPGPMEHERLTGHEHPGCNPASSAGAGSTPAKPNNQASKPGPREYDSTGYSVHGPRGGLSNRSRGRFQGLGLGYEGPARSSRSDPSTSPPLPMQTQRALGAYAMSGPASHNSAASYLDEPYQAPQRAVFNCPTGWSTPAFNEAIGAASKSSIGQIFGRNHVGNWKDSLDREEQDKAVAELHNEGEKSGMHDEKMHATPERKTKAGVASEGTAISHEATSQIASEVPTKQQRMRLSWRPEQSRQLPASAQVAESPDVIPRPQEFHRNSHKDMSNFDPKSAAAQDPSPELTESFLRQLNLHLTRYKESRDNFKNQFGQLLNPAATKLRENLATAKSPQLAVRAQDPKIPGGLTQNIATPLIGRRVVSKSTESVSPKWSAESESFAFVGRLSGKRSPGNPMVSATHRAVTRQGYPHAPPPSFGLGSAVSKPRAPNTRKFAADSELAAYLRYAASKERIQGKNADNPSMSSAEPRQRTTLSSIIFENHREKVLSKGYTSSRSKDSTSDHSNPSSPEYNSRVKSAPTTQTSSTGASSDAETHDAEQELPKEIKDLEMELDKEWIILHDEDKENFPQNDLNNNNGKKLESSGNAKKDNREAIVEEYTALPRTPPRLFYDAMTGRPGSPCGSDSSYDVVDPWPTMNSQRFLRFLRPE